jgi:DNA-binding beta-propeller fold protein YncE
VTASPPRLLYAFPQPVDPRGFLVLPDAERVVWWNTQNGHHELWRVTKTGWEKVWELPGAWLGVSSVSVPAGAADPAGKWVALANQAELILVRGADGAVVRKWPIKAGPGRLAFAPDGRHLFVANGYNTVYVLRLTDLPE